MSPAAVVSVHGDLIDRDDLENSLRECCGAVTVTTAAAPIAFTDASPASLMVVCEPRESPAKLYATVPLSTRLIMAGASGHDLDDESTPDCIFLDQPDAPTLQGVLANIPEISEGALIRDLLELSLFTSSLHDTWQQLAIQLAQAFHADDCVIVLPEDATCYFARTGAGPDEIDDLARLAASVPKFRSTLIAPQRPGRRYRALLGLTLARTASEQPLAHVLLCRVGPVPFGRTAYRHLRRLATRLSTDLAARVIHERLVQDRENLRALSRIDPVLGVTNRTGLQEELARRMTEAARGSEPMTVAVIDVDGLRLINERHGYPAGDAVLAHVAQVARIEMRMQDVVARYAAGSVALVLPATAPDVAKEVVTRILGAIDAAPVMHEDRPINLTVSAGIAAVRSLDDTGEAALGRAVAARRHARRHGEVIAIADESMQTTVAQPDFLVGATLGGVYQIRHEISSGAFGVVYRAEDLALARPAALKLLRPDLARDTAFVENFRSEAATLARIRHPNLVQVYAFGIDASHVYFAMELIEGQSLDQRIQAARKRRRYLPVAELLGYIQQVGDALEAVHRAGMVHRDVKPENVLIDRVHRRSVLIDVGIAIRRGGTSRAGTPGFTAPEVFDGEAGSPVSDVYSLAALAYALLTTRLPFGEGAPLEILARQVSEEPTRPSDLRHDLPERVDEILLAALSPDPAQRPRTARALYDALATELEQPTLALRLTMERPIADRLPPPKPLVAYDPSSQREVQRTRPSSRGVLFRAAYEVLGARRGANWIAEVSRKNAEIAAAITPQGSLFAWHPTHWLELALEALGPEPERMTLARQLGELAVKGTLRQFYGASPRDAGPDGILQSIDLLWRNYHTWGSAVADVGPSTGRVTISNGRSDAALCAVSAGMLAAIVEGAGGEHPVAEHPTCTARGAASCVFHLRWDRPITRN
jgi:diguanylate cyclase (GGDEF)-like protein